MSPEYAVINGYVFPINKEAIDKIDTLGQLMALEQFLLDGEELSWEEDYPAPGHHRWRELVELTHSRMSSMLMDSHVYARDLSLWDELDDEVEGEPFEQEHAFFGGLALTIMLLITKLWLGYAKWYWKYGWRYFPGVW